jgi:hypothetical protein
LKSFLFQEHFYPEINSGWLNSSIFNNGVTLIFEHKNFRNDAGEIFVNTITKISGKNS